MTDGQQPSQSPDNAGVKVQPKSVLVLEIFPQTLAVVRSLSRAGYNVVLGRHEQKTDVEFSRHCHEVWSHPSFDDRHALEEALSAFLDERADICHIFPVAEKSISSLLDMPRILRRPIDIAMVPRDLFRACQDKSLGNDLGKQAGFLVPESRVVENLAEMDAAMASIAFPVIVKSLRSVRVCGRKAYVISSQAEFEVVFHEWPHEHGDLLVQEYILGTLESCDFVASDGTVVGYCEANSVRTDMSDETGLAVDFESIPPSQDVLSAVRSFVRIHHYSGAGLMQFVRSAKTGQLYFLENNPRLSAGIAHTIACGQDSPLLTLQATSKRAGSVLTEFTCKGQPYKYHYRAHWLLRDLEGWLSQRSILSLQEKIAWLLKTVRSFVRADCHILWQWRDPIPVLRIYAKFAKRILRRLVHLRSSAHQA